MHTLGSRGAEGERSEQRGGVGERSERRGGVGERSERRGGVWRAKRLAWGCLASEASGAGGPPAGLA